MFTEQQLIELDKPLSPLLISTRKGGNGADLKYIEGHDVIDQADRIFGYGMWGYRVLKCQAVTIFDVMTGEPVGVTYEAEGELQVIGCLPIAELGQQAVSAWNVYDVVMARRGKDGDKEAPIQPYEKQIAQRIIVDAHEVARKGAGTDAMKRCLRTYGEQFGNGLYGDGRVMLIDGDQLAEEDLKASFAEVFNVKSVDLERRWSGFVVYSLGRPVKDLSSDHKVQIYANIQQQIKKSA